MKDTWILLGLQWLNPNIFLLHTISSFMQHIFCIYTHFNSISVFTPKMTQSHCVWQAPYVISILQIACDAICSTWTYISLLWDNVMLVMKGFSNKSKQWLPIGECHVLTSLLIVYGMYCLNWNGFCDGWVWNMNMIPSGAPFTNMDM